MSPLFKALTNGGACVRFVCGISGSYMFPGLWGPPYIVPLIYMGLRAMEPRRPPPGSSHRQLLVNA